MNRFNYGSQAVQAVSLVGGLITAGSQLKKTAQNTKKTAESTGKTVEITDDMRNRVEQDRQERLNDRAHEERMARAKAKAQQSVNEYKARSSQPELDTNGLLDLFNNDAAATDNTEVE